MLVYASAVRDCRNVYLGNEVLCDKANKIIMKKANKMFISQMISTP